MTQQEMILDYIDRFGSITPIEAFSDLGITKLASRISELTRKGVEFDREYAKSKNRYGKTVHFMRYRRKVCSTTSTSK